jgi:uncharacterized protein
MGKRTSYEPGTFCWVDLTTPDPEAAKAFYGGLFGWGAEDMPVDEQTTYTMLSLDGDYVGGLYEMPSDQRERGVAPNWLSYVSVETADEIVTRAGELGGEVLAAPFDVFDSGRMAIIAEPTGAMFAVWQPRAHLGAGRVNDIGCLAWNELNTREPEAASRFYAALFGWEMESVEDGGELAYVVIRNKGWTNGGIMPMLQRSGDAPSYWLPYFTVPSCDAAAARVGEMGGEVLAEPFEPGAGKISVVKDPQGAAFAVFEGDTDD